MPDLSVLDTGLDLVMKLILFSSLPLSWLADDAEAGISMGSGEWFPNEPERVLEAALRPVSANRL